MIDRSDIPMPSKEERDASIQIILDRSLAARRPAWQGLSLSALVFGVEDCLFLAVLLGLLPAALWFMPSEPLSQELPAVLFLAAPLLYAAAHILALWKESQCGTLDWKRTCRLSLQTLTALRILLFGGAAVLVGVPMDLLLWQASGKAMSLTRMLGISFSSLFLYAALSLLLRHFRWGIAVPAALWALLGTALLWNERCTKLLLEIPTAVFFLLTGAGLIYCLSCLREMLYNPNKGGSIYAFH